MLQYFPSQFDFITEQIEAFRASALTLGVAGTLALLLAADGLVGAGDVVGTSWFAGVLGRFPGLLVLRGFTVRYATTLLFILVVGFVYDNVPNAKVRFRDVWVGAVVTGVLWKGVLELWWSS